MSSRGIEVLIVEDESDLLELIEYHLSKEGYSTTGFLSTESVEQFIEEESPSLMIIDRNLPGVEGSDFVEYLRSIGYNIPVIFLTAKDKEDDLVKGFESGGDDYMTKPFSYKELLLRVNALLKRSGISDTQKVKFRDITLDLATKEVSIGADIVNLTQLEFQLLYTFVKSPNIALDRDYLRDEVWGDSSENFHDKTINVAMNRLKKKIDPNSTKNYLQPVWGVGYKLN
ncbi:Two-component system response regulator [hydrothermal vent metagenome]|uniref:Two-component system response regulator n=1 Tax=hydrothermal vent metagenome TaxID=652676 RepID=A0A1W1BZP0_9ZZZZ